VLRPDDLLAFSAGVYSSTSSRNSKKTLLSRHAQHADSPPNEEIRMLRMAAQKSWIH
jgi:hypothetical protein